MTLTKGYRDLIGSVIIDALSKKDADKRIRNKAAKLTEADQAKFIEAVETEILALREYNFARYRVRPKKFERCKSGR